MWEEFQIVSYTIFLNSKLLINPVYTYGQKLIPAQAVIFCVGENEHGIILYFLNKERDPYGRGRLWKMLKEFMLSLQNRGRGRLITDSDKYSNTTVILNNRMIGEIFIPAQQYVWYLDLLRNEDPVYAHVFKDKPELNTIIVGGESVGDGELKNLFG